MGVITQMVSFQLGEERYAIDIMKIKEIVQVNEVIPIPNAPSYIDGIFSLRGEDILPLVSLHKRFGIPEKVLTEEEKLLSGSIILNLDKNYLAINIDKILKVVQIDSDNMKAPPQIVSSIGTKYIKAITEDEDGFYLIILDVDKLFDKKELEHLYKITEGK